MTEAKSARQVYRGRIFPQIQWTEPQKAQWKAERQAFKQRCELIFAQVQPELLKSHYNWYIAVEPESGEYCLDKDAFMVAQKAHAKYPNVKLHLFRINEIGVCGRI